MNRIRLNNGELPLGDIDLIFSTIYSRFAHKELIVSKANISKIELDTTLKYHIEYLSYERKISIEVEKEFPHKILSWTENNGDGLITEARFKKSINAPYWEQKRVIDEAKRDTLQLIH